MHRGQRAKRTIAYVRLVVGCTERFAESGVLLRAYPGNCLPRAMALQVYQSIPSAEMDITVATGLVSCPRNTRYFVAIKMGCRQGGPSRTGGWREHI